MGATYTIGRREVVRVSFEVDTNLKTSWISLSVHVNSKKYGWVPAVLTNIHNDDGGEETEREIGYAVLEAIRRSSSSSWKELHGDVVTEEPFGKSVEDAFRA